MVDYFITFKTTHSKSLVYQIKGMLCVVSLAVLYRYLALKFVYASADRDDIVWLAQLVERRSHRSYDYRPAVAIRRS